MTPIWLATSGFSAKDVVPAALELLNEAYVIGMLRAVIPRAGDGWEELAVLVLLYERGEGDQVPLAPKAFKRLTNGQGSAFIAGRAAHILLRTGRDRVAYSWFASSCAAILCEPGDAPEDAWVRAVNSLVQEDR